MAKALRAWSRKKCIGQRIRQQRQLRLQELVQKLTEPLASVKNILNKLLIASVFIFLTGLRNRLYTFAKSRLPYPCLSGLQKPLSKKEALVCS
jgi:hypothetical protein